MICLTNARIVLADDSDQRDGRASTGRLIRSVEPGPTSLRRRRRHRRGHVLIAGVVDLHTDNLERQVQPRSNARWPSRSAMVAHDAQCAAAGVTTVFDALCLGDLGFDKDRIRTFREGVADGDALAGTGLLKSEHYLHLRCELPSGRRAWTLLDPVADHPARAHDQPDGPLARHGPVSRPRLLSAACAPRTGTAAEARSSAGSTRFAGATGADTATPNRRALLDRVRPRGVVLASHDDRTAQEIAENHQRRHPDQRVPGHAWQAALRGAWPAACR